MCAANVSKAYVLRSLHNLRDHLRPNPPAGARARRALPLSPMCRLLCAAIAVWISAMLAMSGCSLLQDLIPPPLATALSPAPLPPAPPGPHQHAAGAAAAEPGASVTRPGPRRNLAMAYGARIPAISSSGRAVARQVESGFQPCAASPGGFRYTFQWGSTRLEQLHRFAHTDGCPQHVQPAFADWELRNDPKFSCFWGATKPRHGPRRACRRRFGRGSC